MGSFHLEDLIERCKYLKQEFDVRAIIVDYLELETGSENDILKEIKALKNLAVSLDVPILLVINMIEDNEHQLTHFAELKDLGDIEPLADIVLFIRKATVPGFSDFIKLLNIAIAKNPAVETGIVELRYEPDSGRLFDSTQIFSGNQFWKPT